MSNPTDIKQVNIRVVQVPLNKPFTTARHTVTQMSCVQVAIELVNGLVGHGSATPNKVVTGDTLDSVKTILETVLVPKIHGKDLFQWEQLLLTVQHAIEHNTPAKTAIEIALYDLRSQLFGVPLVNLLGSSNHQITTDFTIGIDTTPNMIMDAQTRVKQGFTALKLKIGTHSLSKDLSRVKQISNAIGSDSTLRLDANQAWSTEEALNAIRELEQLNLPIEFIEQPVLADNLSGLQQVTQASKIPIMADESVFSVADTIKLLELHACNYINIKLMKTGGLNIATQINQLCEQYGVKCMIGCMIESQISLAAAVAFAASHKNVVFADLDAVYMSAESENPVYFQLNRNTITLNDHIGLG